MWKGDKIGYWGIHAWIKREYGSPKKCDDCGTTTAKKFEWANISKKYIRDISDWKRLCTKCHNSFDNANAKGENHGSCRLTSSQVIKIRQMYIPRKHNSYNTYKLAKKFNVSRGAIQAIVEGRTWKHI